MNTYDKKVTCLIRHIVYKVCSDFERRSHQPVDITNFVLSCHRIIFGQIKLVSQQLPEIEREKDYDAEYDGLIQASHAPLLLRPKCVSCNMLKNRVCPSDIWGGGGL